MLHYIDKLWPIVSAIGVGGFAVLRFWLTHRAKKEAIEELRMEVDKEIREQMKKETVVPQSPVSGNHIIQSVMAIKRVHNILNYTVANTDAIRAIVIKAHNGGKIPTLTEKMYVTIMHESIDKNIEQIATRFQAQEIDSAYFDLLIEIIQKKKLSKKSVDLQQGCMLHDLYTRTGVTFSKIYEIYYNPKQYVFLSVQFKKEQDVTPKERDIIRSAAMEIRNIFRDEAKSFNQ